MDRRGRLLRWWEEEPHALGGSQGAELEQAPGTGLLCC